jgi:ABC-type polysaccharide/polyol phosphate export permease
MLANSIVVRLVVLCFMILVGFSIAKSIQTESVLAFLLAILSLGAGIYCVYLLHKVREQKKII